MGKYQESFIKYLKHSANERTTLADDLAEILNVSKDSAYRRLRNETPLTIDEAMIICDHFNIDLSAFFEMKYETIPFKFSKLYSGSKDMESYLKGISQMVELGLSVNAEVILAAEDIPVFHHFESPILAGFKIFYWQKAVLNDESLIGQKYHVRLVHPNLLELANDIAKKYNQLHTVEIWTEDSVNSTLSQVLYFAESGQFEDKEYALRVLNEVRKMVDGLLHKAERSSKTLDDNRNFTLFNSEVRIGNNSIYIESEKEQRVFISHNTFNSISTDNRDFCKETSLWLSNLMRKSTPINDVSEKHRYQFFRKIYRKLEETEEKILAAYQMNVNAFEN